MCLRDVKTVLILRLAIFAKTERTKAYYSSMTRRIPIRIEVLYNDLGCIFFFHPPEKPFSVCGHVGNNKQ